MPTRRVTLHDEAAADYDAAFEWYAERSPDAARKFDAEVARAMGEVAEAPDRWARGLYGTRRFLLRGFPFLLIYRERATRSSRSWRLRIPAAIQDVGRHACELLLAAELSLGWRAEAGCPYIVLAVPKTKIPTSGKTGQKWGTLLLEVLRAQTRSGWADKCVHPYIFSTCRPCRRRGRLGRRELPSFQESPPPGLRWSASGTRSSRRSAVRCARPSWDRAHRP